jgi:exodeoxyribonuclease VII large subunit
VADAVFRSVLPVIAAIGHESDTTIIDLVADVRAATPTQAAVRLVPSSEELIRHVEHDADRLSRVLRRALDSAGRSVESLAEAHSQAMRHALSRRRLNVERWNVRLESRRPTRLLADRRMRIGLLDHRLHLAMERVRAVRPELEKRQGELRRALLRRIDGHQRTVAAMHGRLQAIEVASVLRRGFSYTMRDDGRLVTTIRDVEVGGGLKTHVADGVIDSLVRGARSRTSSPGGETRAATADASGASDTTAARSKRRARRARPSHQLDLFASNG